MEAVLFLFPRFDPDPDDPGPGPAEYPPVAFGDEHDRGVESLCVGEAA